MTTQSATELGNLKNEVLRKVGRNLMIFQQMEAMLKLLLGNGVIEGYASELESRAAKRAAEADRKTMGQLVGQFFENHFADGAGEAKAPEELREPWFSFGWSVALNDATAYEQHKAAFADVVSERNELAHHCFSRYDWLSNERLGDAEQYLDRQRERIAPEWERLKGFMKANEDSRRYLASEEVQGQLELALFRHSRLVILLGQIAQQVPQQTGRDDGCVPLDTAGQLLRLHAADEYAHMRERYGYKSLKSLIVAAGVFDIVDEPTVKGGVRVLYRIRPAWTLEIGEPSSDAETPEPPAAFSAR